SPARNTSGVSENGCLPLPATIPASGQATDSTARSSGTSPAGPWSTPPRRPTADATFSPCCSSPPPRAAPRPGALRTAHGYPLCRSPTRYPSPRRRGGTSGELVGTKRDTGAGPAHLYVYYHVAGDAAAAHAVVAALFAAVEAKTGVIGRLL